MRWLLAAFWVDCFMSHAMLFLLQPCPAEASLSDLIPAPRSAHEHMGKAFSMRHQPKKGRKGNGSVSFPTRGWTYLARRKLGRGGSMEGDDETIRHRAKIR